MSEKAASANVQFCKLQDEPKTKHKKGKHELLIDWVRSSQIWKKKNWLLVETHTLRKWIIKVRVQDLSQSYCVLNPLTLGRSNLLVTSPYNIHTLPSQQVMRILRLTGSCYLDLTPNSHNLFMRKCVAVRGENYMLSLDLWSQRIEPHT